MVSGLPGSGKSTRVKQLVKDSGNAGRVNRDDLRAMLFDGVWSGPREKVVVEIEKAISSILIKNNLTAIIDDTNLHQSHKDMWSNFSKENNATFEMNFTDTDLLTCIQRDKNRPKPVGEAVITRMALEANMINFYKPIVIVDIDGTIADGSHREHYVTLNNGRTKKDWDGYFCEMIYDKPIQHIINWVEELYKDNTICIVSGRSDTYQLETLYWLRYVAKIKFDYIFMRRGNDRRPDVEVKSDILAKLPKEQIVFAIDDRPSVVNGCWRKNGVMVIPVRGECEDF